MAWERWRRDHGREEGRASWQEKQNISSVFQAQSSPLPCTEGQLHGGALKTVKDKPWRSSYSGVNLVLRAKWMSYYYDTNDNIFPHQAKDSCVYSSGRHQKHLDSSLPQQVTSVGNCVTANVKDLSGAVP